MDSFAERIELYLQIAWRAKCCSDYESWARRVESLLASSLGTEAAEAFLSLGGEAPSRTGRSIEIARLAILKAS